ncbi:hypothetical protein BDAP_002154 [Binucleata daphniae]
MVQNTDIKSKECQHYIRKCAIIAECCKKAYKCRFCHDDAEIHRINRYEIKDMICLICNTKQKARQECIKCKGSMSDYYCNICKLWTEIKEPIFHCLDCNVCRIGEKEKYFHCKVCNACMDIRLKNKHIHIENTLIGDCPICAEIMLHCQKDISMLSCGHSMHTECFQHFNLTNYHCPICSKIAGDTTEFKKKVDYMLSKTEKYEDNFIKPNVDILCYDCCKTSQVKKRHIYNKCPECNSYNTRVKEPLPFVHRE